MLKMVDQYAGFCMFDLFKNVKKKYQLSKTTLHLKQHCVI